MAPSLDAPVCRVATFDSVWQSHRGGPPPGPPFATAGAGGVDLMAGERGVTVWRPQPPMGYGILGHVLASGAQRNRAPLAPILLIFFAQRFVRGLH